MSRQEVRKATWNPWAYHLLTIGSVLLLVSLITLIMAGIGLLLADMSAPVDPASPIWVTPMPHPGPTP